MLEVRNIQKSFGGVRAIQGSSFVVEKGKTTALIGPNGAGKTTLFDIITGFVRPDTGSVWLGNEEITERESFDRAALGISRTFQQVRLFRYLSLLDHLRMIEDGSDTKLAMNLLRSDRVDTRLYQTILEEFGIERDLKTLVSELSYGQRKLLHLAMAVKRPHKLLLLDEPVAGVNKKIQERIEGMLLKMKESGETMLIVDHDMGFIRRLADQVIVLDAGVVIAQGPPEIVLEDPRVVDAYLGI